MAGPDKHPPPKYLPPPQRCRDSAPTLVLFHPPLFHSSTITMRAGQVALITAGAAVTSVVGYALYFDYMRRNSPTFRKGLRECCAKDWRRFQRE